jgi:hypothetical protein
MRLGGVGSIPARVETIMTANHSTPKFGRGILMGEATSAFALFLVLFISCVSGPAGIAQAAGDGGVSSDRGTAAYLGLGLGLASDGDGTTHKALLVSGGRGRLVLRGGLWGSSFAAGRAVVASDLVAVGYDHRFAGDGLASVGSQVYLSRVCDTTAVRFPGSSATQVERSVSGGAGVGMDVRLGLGPARLRLGWESHLFVGSPAMLVYMASIKKTLVFVEIGGAL